MSEKSQDEKETERRRDEALRRALSTPPTPHKKGEDDKDKKPERKHGKP